MTTRAQAESNKNNAKKSTGPKTEAGKKRSSLNSLIHGLRAEEIVLPGEDPAAFEAERAAWFDDFQPKSQARAALVERAVVAAWRCRRCVRMESIRLGTIGRKAIAKHSDDARKRVDAAVAQFSRQPRQSLQILEAESEGILTLIGTWTELADAASSAEHWASSHTHHGWLFNLLGLPDDSEAEDAGPVGVASWRLLVRVQPEIGEDTYGPMDDRELARSLRNLQTFIHDKIAGLKTWLSRFKDPEQSGFRAAAANYIDHSESGKLLMRYETMHDRSLRATISSLIQLEKSGIDLAGAEPEPTSEAIAPSEAIDPKPSEDKALQPASAPMIVADPLEVDPGGSPITDPTPFAKPERDRGGRSWDGKDELMAGSSR